MSEHHAIRIHPPGTRITDYEMAESLGASVPTAFRKSQDLLVATDNWMNKQGLFSSKRSRARKLQACVHELADALEKDGFLGVDIESNRKPEVLFDFLSRFSDAFPNWQREYEALNRFIPTCF